MSNTRQEAIVKLFLSILGIFYLIIIPFGHLESFKLTDVSILVVILIFNSKIIERLTNLDINKDGITLTLQELKQKQDEQRESIEVNSNNIKANRNVLQRLASLEQQIADSKSNAHFVVANLVNPYEWQHLLKLANKDPFNYDKTHSFEQELRELRALGFIESKQEVKISSLPENGDLKSFFTITKQGKEYIAKREAIELEHKSSSNKIFN